MLERDRLREAFVKTRAMSERMTDGLQPEDFGLQAITETSPAKWHLAHTTWFFETFLLGPFVETYKVYDPVFGTLYNSYYNLVGRPFDRAKRGLLSRPAIDKVFAYRAHVTERMQNLIETQFSDEIAFRLKLGIQHEMQHQELFFTDIKYNLYQNPLRPAYRAEMTEGAGTANADHENTWTEFAGALVECGIPSGTSEFHFDNETPRHPTWLQPFALQNRLVTNADYLAFMSDDGYERSELWLSDGWDFVQDHNVKSPLYWEKNIDSEDWQIYTLAGMTRLDPTAPVCHISYYEADAFARWKNCRLPTEFEWEHAGHNQPLTGNVLETDTLGPKAANGAMGLTQMFGDVWEWTASAYSAYPGFKPHPGAIGEYNGKFMSNQFVLRGGSCVTPSDQVRLSYRNFFQPDARWQFSGLRLAKDIT